MEAQHFKNCNHITVSRNLAQIINIYINYIISTFSKQAMSPSLFQQFANFHWSTALKNDDHTSSLNLQRKINTNTLPQPETSDMSLICDALLSGFRLMSLLLDSASSVIETRPCCLIYFATDSSSSIVMYMNFPLSSTTPVSLPSSCSSCTRWMASYN